MYASYAALEKPEFHQQAAHFFNQPQTSGSNHFMNEVQSAIPDTVIAEVEREVTDCLDDSIVTAVE